MKLETLQNAMIEAMKVRDKARKDSIATLVSAAKKAGIDAGCREAIPEEMVDQAILKELKAVKEQVETCPKERAELLAEYQARLEVFKEFAPKMMNVDEIKTFVQEKFADVVATKNKGAIMKAVMPELKGKADGKEIGAVVAELCK